MCVPAVGSRNALPRRRARARPSASRQREKARLQLRLATVGSALDGAEEGDLGREGGDSVVLLRLASLVLLLEGLEELIEVGVGLLELSLLGLNLLVKVSGGERLLLLDCLLLVGVAEVDVVRAAGGAEVLLGPLGEGVVVASAVVGVALRRGAPVKYLMVG